MFLAGARARHGGVGGRPGAYGAASTGAVVQGYATPPPQAAQAVVTVAPPPYTATPQQPPQAVAEVVAVAPMDRK